MKKENTMDEQELVERVERNISECQDEEEDFDWETYQYLCDIADYWDCDE